MTINYVENTKWKCIDSHWKCVSRFKILDSQQESLDPYFGTLADYLWMLGFDISESIQYCLAQNSSYKIKYSFAGGLIDIFVTKL